MALTPDQQDHLSSLAQGGAMNRHDYRIDAAVAEQVSIGNVDHIYPVHAVQVVNGGGGERTGGYVEKIGGVDTFCGDIEAFLDICCADLVTAREALRALVTSMPKLDKEL